MVAAKPIAASRDRGRSPLVALAWHRDGVEFGSIRLSAFARARDRSPPGEVEKDACYALRGMADGCEKREQQRAQRLFPTVEVPVVRGASHLDQRYCPARATRSTLDLRSTKHQMRTLRGHLVKISETSHAPTAAREPRVVHREWSGLDAQIKGQRVPAETLDVSLGKQHVSRLSVEARRMVLTGAIASGT